MRQDAREFLDIVWPDPEVLVETDSRIALFSLPTSESHLASGLDDAAVAAEQWAEDHREVYLTVTSMRADLATRQSDARRRGHSAPRGSVADAVLFPALVADFDVESRDRKKPNLFKTMAEAQDCLAEALVPPTAIVYSGGGIQAWWCYNEPMDLRAADEKQRAEMIALRFRDHLQDLAKKRSRSIDSVFDLARIMRLPGTLNWKRAGGDRQKAASVTLASYEGRRPRYNPQDLIDVLPQSRDEMRHSVAGSSVVGRLVLDPDAIPPFDKFNALLENDERFKMTVEHKRKDMRDQSLSSYDMSLAHATVRCEWTDQEITDLLIYHRRRYQGDLKLREKYYSDTISHARASVQMSDLASEITSTGGLNPGDPTTAPKVMAFFSNVTGVTLQRVIVYLPNRNQLTLEFADNRSLHTTLDELFDWGRFWRALRRSGFSPRTSPAKKDTWLAMVNGLYEVAEEVQVETSGDPAVVASLVFELARLSQVDIDARVESTEEQRGLAITKNGAFSREGKIWVRLPGIKRLADEMKLNEQMRSTDRLRAILSRELGGVARLFNVRVSERVIDAAGPRRAKDAEIVTRQVGGTLYGIEPSRLRLALDQQAADEKDQEKDETEQDEKKKGAAG